MLQESDAYTAVDKCHAVAILTEWGTFAAPVCLSTIIATVCSFLWEFNADAFKTLDWRRVYDSMEKPAFVFDGRNILNHKELRELGFEVSRARYQRLLLHRRSCCRCMQLENLFEAHT
jgi:UDPglucose 6-dehydrogenase